MIKTEISHKTTTRYSAIVNKPIISDRPIEYYLGSVESSYPDNNLCIFLNTEYNRKILFKFLSGSFISGGYIAEVFHGKIGDEVSYGNEKFTDFDKLFEAIERDFI